METDHQEQSNQSDQPETTQKQILFTVLFLIGTAVFVFIVLEIGVRLTTQPVLPLNSSHEKVGSIYKTNVHDFVWNHESEEEVLVITNSLGYRDEKEPADNRVEDISIALIGDSFTASIQVDQYETFIHQLEVALNAAAPSTSAPIRLYNYGVGGTGTFSQILRFREHVQPYNMDAVGLFFNHDFGDNLNKAEYSLDTYSEAEDRNVGLRKILLNSALVRFTFANLRQHVWFLQFLNKLGLYEISEYQAERWQEGTPLTNDTIDEEFYTYTFDLIRTLRDNVEASGSTFFVLLRSYNQQSEDDISFQHHERTKAFLEAEDITYYESGIDYREPYGEAGVCLELRCAGHFTAFGHAVFAQALFPAFSALVARLASLETNVE